MIYVASPYSADEPAMEAYRFEKTIQIVADMIMEGLLVISPIVHSHPIYTRRPETGAQWESWVAIDTELLRRCDEVVVLMIPGWQESRGVTAEIELAAEFGIPVTYREVE
jgi:hypothetical protein